MNVSGFGHDKTSPKLLVRVLKNKISVVQFLGFFWED